MAQRGRPKKPTLVIKKQALTKEQIETLRKIESNLGDLRRRLSNFDEHETLSKMSFNAGIVYKIADETEDEMVTILEDILGYDDKYEF